MKAKGFSRATFALEPTGDTVKLTVTHEMERQGSKFIEAVSTGWPSMLWSLKSLLETGKALERPGRALTSSGAMKKGDVYPAKATRGCCRLSLE